MVFVDAWFYIALMHAGDEHHDRVAAWFRTYRGRFVTTRPVLTEFANSLSAPRFRSKVAAMLWRLENDPRVRIIGSSDALYARGLHSIHSDQTKNGRSRIACRLSQCRTKGLRRL